MFRDDGRSVIIIDVLAPIEEVVDRIVSCDLIASSSLHGLVVAQGYGVQLGWVEFSGRLKGDGVKFADYFAAVSVPILPKPLQIRSRVSVAQLQAFVRDQPQAALESLRQPLLDTCPFRQRDSGPGGDHS